MKLISVRNGTLMAKVFLVCAIGLVVYIPFSPRFGSDETYESKQSREIAEIDERRARLMGDVIGRWCDEMIPNLPNYNYAISIAGIEEPHVIFDFADGSVKIDPLEIRNSDKPNVYSMIESSSGENFEINTTGSLYISDEDGLIRIASNLEEAIKNGTCTK